MVAAQKLNQGRARHGVGLEIVEGTVEQLVSSGAICNKVDQWQQFARERRQRLGGLSAETDDRRVWLPGSLGWKGWQCVPPSPRSFVRDPLQDNDSR